MTRSRRRRWPWILGGILGAFVVLALIWDWNWFRPMIEARASAAAGRPVHIGHFDIHLAWHPQVVIDEIAVDNPKEGFEPDSKAATVKRLAVRIDPWSFLHDRAHIDEVLIDQPRGDLHPGSNGIPNWVFGDGKTEPTAPKPKEPATPARPLNLDRLVLTEGRIHFLDPQFKSDFVITAHTEDPPGGGESRIVIGAEGRYAGQPITAHFVGGSVLRLRNPQNPYPVDLQVANGETHVSLKGSLLDPMQFGGASLVLDFEGKDLAQLYPLTGVPLAPSPPYKLTGNLDYQRAQTRVRFTGFQGRVGNSDLSGDIFVEPGRERRKITADMHSDKVVLADLAGFIGAPPGKADDPEQSAKQKAERAKVEASPKLLPQTPINLPKLRAADFDVRYAAKRIESDKTPLDDISTHLVVDDGALSLKPLAFSVGSGKIVLNVALDGQQDLVHAVADIDFRQIELARIMQKSTAFNGSGTIGGSARIDTTGNSLGAMLGRGNGDLKLFMTGGDLSALLVDLAGLDLGNSILSAIGIPSRAELRCLVADYSLKDGQLSTNLLLADTTEANVVGKGSVDLKNENVDYRLETEPKHFNVGSLAAPINIKGPLKSPSILPDLTTLGVRATAATLLGLFATPVAALIPTIQLGLGKDNDCNQLLDDLSPKAKAANEKQQKAAKASPDSRKRHGGKR